MLELYLSDKYLKEKDQNKFVRDLIKKVIPIYEKFYEKGWGYKVEECTENVSTSTTAMITFSMSVLMSGKLDLVTDNIGENFLKSANYQKIFNDSLKLLLNTFKINIETPETLAKREFTFKSKTYGENDPFTLMWTRYLIDGNDNNKYNIDDFEEIKEAFDIKCKEKVITIFKTLYKDKDNLVFSSTIEKTHIFPLLKVVQLYNSMTPTGNNEFYVSKTDKKKDIDNYVNEVRNTLKNSLHYHLSLANIENSNFDAAELVFSLEGLLLLDFNRNNFDQNLLEKVFEVIKERQKISLYWRPLKPFVFDERGLALLPLSVEIAMSLIRICRLLDKRGEKLFSKNHEMFEKYTEWLKTRVTVVPCDKTVCNKCTTKKWCTKQKGSPDEKKFYGWCSEHIYQPHVVHPWETSQVLVYLVNYDNMLQRHISYQSLKFANFSIENYGKDNKDKKVWIDFQLCEPVNIENFQVYQEIGDHYLDSDEMTKDSSNYYSMLLYGPPGTGKSTIAEKIAEAKGWPLVTITPSDFIASGADKVESKAKNIFKVLEEQKNMVVLFDEIDRLILDRDSNYYTSQSDLFQFMTPSMLVKLKDLRKKKKTIFIIATNYAERIDMAIKRKGRIDHQYLVLPPDMGGREKLFKELIDKKLGKNKFKFNKYKDMILRETVFFTYNEFDQLTDVIKNDYADAGKVGENELKKLIKKAAITLMSYKGKLGTEKKEKNTQKPTIEFLSLVYLKAETCDEDMNAVIFDDNEINLLIDFLCSKGMLCMDIKIETKNEYNDDFKGDLDFIITHLDKLKIIMKKYIYEQMTDKIIDLLNGIKRIRDKEVAKNKC